MGIHGCMYQYKKVLARNKKDTSKIVKTLSVNSAKIPGLIYVAMVHSLSTRPCQSCNVWSGMFRFQRY